MSDYLARLLQAHTQGAFQPGTVTVLSVAHDDGCKRPEGGPCTCIPDMTAQTPTGKTDIATDGTPNEGGKA